MGTNRTHRFGPGSLESIRLIEAPAHHERFQFERTGHRQVRVEGWFTVYCGMGNEHTERIKSPPVCLNCASGEGLPIGFVLGRSYLSDPAVLALGLVWAELEDWFDPCDDGQEV